MGIEIENMSSTNDYVLTTEAYDVFIDDVVVTSKDYLIGTLKDVREYIYGEIILMLRLENRINIFLFKL